MVSQKEPSFPVETAKKVDTVGPTPFFIPLSPIDKLSQSLHGMKGQDTPEYGILRGGMLRLYIKAKEVANEKFSTKDEVIAHKFLVEYIANQLRSVIKGHSPIFIADEDPDMAKTFLEALTLLGEKEVNIWTTMKERAPILEKQPQTKEVLYICALGQERSVAAATLEKGSGNSKADFLRGGYLGIDQAVLGPVRTRCQVELGFLGKNYFSPEELQRLNTRISIEAPKALAEWIRQKKWDKKRIRIFNDENANGSSNPMVSLLTGTLIELRIPFELITMDQIAHEFPNARTANGDWLSSAERV